MAYICTGKLFQLHNFPNRIRINIFWHLVLVLRVYDRISSHSLLTYDQFSFPYIGVEFFDFPPELGPGLEKNFLFYTGINFKENKREAMDFSLILNVLT